MMPNIGAGSITQHSGSTVLGSRLPGRPLVRTHTSNFQRTDSHP